MRAMMQKYYLSFTSYRHVHFELSSISRELNNIFGLQMMIQTAMYHLCTVHYILSFYQLVILVRSNSTYVSVIRVFCFFLWALRCMINIIIFNYICEGVSAKVKFADSLKKLMRMISFSFKTTLGC